MATKLLTAVLVLTYVALPISAGRWQRRHAAPLDCSTKLKFRTYDGTCNNLKNPTSGASFTRYLHAVLTDRDDVGSATPRLARDGQPLPSARLISNTLFKDIDQPSDRTLLFAYFGQIIAHDIVQTSGPHNEDTGEPLSVDCGGDGCSTENEYCFPIVVPPEDPFFEAKKCLKFIRSYTAKTEPVNEVTHYLDGSFLYGSSEEENEKLRDKSNRKRGRMLLEPHPMGDGFEPMLPRNEEPDICPKKDFKYSAHCLKAGDSRSNVNAGLGMFHTLWAREHNYIEKKLHAVNKRWDGNRLFEETRRIVVAIFQHIVYTEYLELVLGEFFKVTGPESSHSRREASRGPMSLTTEFVAAAFRFGHTTIPGTYQRIKNKREKDEVVLSMTFNDPEELFNIDMDGIDGFVRGAADQESQNSGFRATSQLTNHLFAQDPPTGPGLDLIAMNIQRGRDFNLPGYARSRLGPPIDKNAPLLWTDFLKLGISQDVIDNFMAIYNDPSDVDFYVGGLAESVEPGMSVGLTFAVLIGLTFEELKFEDRFFYDNPTAGFTPDQLNLIKTQTLRDVLCRNTDKVKSLQNNVFLKKSDTNLEVSCKSSKQLDLSAWKSTN